jgi:hypothetical protein
MQHITVEHLHILHLELGLVADRQKTGIVLLPTLFGVKVGLVKDDSECLAGRNLGG